MANKAHQRGRAILLCSLAAGELECWAIKKDVTAKTRADTKEKGHGSKRGNRLLLPQFVGVGKIPFLLKKEFLPTRWNQRTKN